MFASKRFWLIALAALGSLAALALLALLAVYLVLSHQFEPAESDAEAVEAFFGRPAERPAFAAPDREPCAERHPLRRAWFGDFHVHSALSFDAVAFGVLATPEEAYRFARGEETRLTRSDRSSVPQHSLRLHEPLDFIAVTDHAEHFGEMNRCVDADSPAYDTGICRAFRGEVWLPVPERFEPMVRLMSLAAFGKRRSRQVCGDDGAACLALSEAVWQRLQRAAEAAYDRSEACQMTSWVAYEYSLSERSANLHRNVIFANATVPPAPLSAKDAPRPEALWRWLDAQCNDSGTGCAALAIPHNSNWSSGRMFAPDRDGTLDERRARAARRARIEPLVEIMQVKGDSECRSGIPSVLGDEDPWCDFEKLRAPSEPVVHCGDEVGSQGMLLAGCVSRWSYARYGLIQGLAEADQLGVNPFAFGFIAATDTHNGTGGAVREDEYFGANGTDLEVADRLQPALTVPGIAKGQPLRYNPGGLAGVWAQENNRESLFAALRRRETFGTSGPRIRPRFFGGWGLPAGLCERADMLETAYRDGVPMGGVLPRRVASAPETPNFLVTAMRDPAPDGGLLDRAQVVKGWTDERGRTHQRVYDVAGGDRTADVDLDTCRRRGDGHRQFCTVWRDPSFDPSRRAVYYLRVLENPSCRWSTRDCLALRARGETLPAACSDANIDKTIQERAWTSAIWYAPGERAVR